MAFVAAVPAVTATATVSPGSINNLGSTSFTVIVGPSKSPLFIKQVEVKLKAPPAIPATYNVSVPTVSPLFGSPSKTIPLGASADA